MEKFLIHHLATHTHLPQVKFDYKINDAISVFANVGGLFDVRNNLFTTAFKIGFIGEDFLIISFDLISLQIGITKN